MPRLSTFSRRTHVSREGWLWLFAAAGLWATGVVKGINLILLLAYILIGMWALNWVVARRSLRGLTVKRRLGEPIFAGRPILWEIEVENTGSAARFGWHAEDRGADHAVHWAGPALAPRRAVRLRREVTLPRRGLYDAERVRLSTSYPFGLVRFETALPDDDKVIVLPRLGTLHAGRLRWWLRQTARPDERCRRSRRQVIHEMEFHGLRQFRPGDSPRWIHWRTTARRGELMVREFDQGSQNDLCLIVAPGPDGLDATLSLAATIVWNWSIELGDSLVLAIAAEGGTCLSSKGGREQKLRMLEALAVQTGKKPVSAAAAGRLLAAVEIPLGPALLVGGRTGPARLADAISALIDRPVAFLDANRPPDFYEPPAVGLDEEK